MNYAIIMAGGSGTRFWPASREEKPKQFLTLASSRPMVLDTIRRITPVVPRKNIFIITNKKQLPLAKKLRLGIPIKNIIAEPVGRNTAPCLGLGALLAKHMKGKKPGVVIALPADHIIKKEKKFLFYIIINILLEDLRIFFLAFCVYVYLFY